MSMSFGLLEDYPLPHRFAPSCPEPLARSATRAQVQRFQAAYQAWYVGTALREYAQTLHTASRYQLPDDLSILCSPRYDSPSYGRRLAANGTPTSMDEICSWIDRQARTVAPVAQGYKRLRADLPQVAAILWVRHVDLLTVDEIAAQHNISHRTVLRYLRVGHLRLTANMEYATGAKNSARKTSYRADHAEAQMHRTGEFIGTPSAEELAESGVVVIEKPRIRQKRVRVR